LTVIAFTVPGQPVAKARARVYYDKRLGRSRGVTPKSTRRYEEAVAWYAQEAMRGLPPLRGPMALHVTLGMRMPASWSRKRKLEAATGKIAPTKKPDMSNLIKGIEDAMNHIVYHDDGQIVEHVTRKQYCLEPHARITVIQLDAKPARN